MSFRGKLALNYAKWDLTRFFNRVAASLTFRNMSNYYHKKIILMKVNVFT